MATRVLLLELCLLGALGCGARAFSGDPGEEDLDDGAGGNRAAPVNTAGGGTERPVDPLQFDGEVLPPCEPGFRPGGGDGDVCPFRFESLCYESPRGACACACSGVTRPRCEISGFLLSDTPEVRCVPR